MAFLPGKKDRGKLTHTNYKLLMIPVCSYQTFSMQTGEW